MIVARAALAFGLALLLASCGASDDDDGNGARSAPLDSLSELPLTGVLISDCTEDAAQLPPSEDAIVDAGGFGLVHLPQLESISGTDLQEFLLLLDLHGQELPIVSSLVPTSDPSLFLPLPVSDLLDVLALDSIPLDTRVLGVTSFGCEEEDAPPLGLIPVLGGVPS